MKDFMPFPSTSLGIGSTYLQVKSHPKTPRCAVVGTSNGAVDPKTQRKWVWAFIKAIYELVDVVMIMSVFD